jgi:class 3 adenylate cyclase/tetratricopeptide (TPR) repeat protein
MGSVRQWLEARGFGEYVEAFEREQLDLEALLHLTADDLKDLGLPMGPRLKLLAAIRSLREGRAEPEADTSAASRSGARAERRQLTVMFCDLVDSTRLAEMLDPEELRELMRAYQTACAQAVARYEGHVAQYLGDGLMVYFGWPKAHEDDAERSVRAGLEMIEAIKRVAAREPLRARIGIATGQVVVGETGAGDASVPKMAVGETPNLAARMQGRAAPGEILVSDTTRRLLAGAFDLEDRGSHALKGFADPVRVWRVCRESRSLDRFAAARAGRLQPLVGRASELALLAERWQQAIEGEGQVVLLCGEPGVGKSRITHALRQRIAGTPHAWIQYQCSPFFSDSALHPVIEQLKRAAGFTDEASAEERLSRLEALIERSGGAPAEELALLAALLSLPLARYPALKLSPQQLKARTIETIAGQLERLATLQPVLLVVEDAHWIDPTTRELVDQLVARVAGARALMLVTHRPEFEPPWGGHAHLTRHSLNRLSRRQCAELAGRLAPKALPEALLAHIVDKTDGVPLYVEEMTKAVLESDLLVDTGHDYALRGTLESLTIPATLHDSLMARLDRLLPVKELAQIGAAIGREFGHDLLAAVSPMSAAELEAALDDFVRSELIYRRGTAPHVTYVFKHALVQEAAYNSLLRGKRGELHERIAATLEARFPDTAPEVIARHYTAAGSATRAVPYWRKAGHAALARAANREALGHFGRALELLRSAAPGGGDDSGELELLLGLGEAQLRSGENLGAMKTFERAAARAEARQDAAGMAHAALGFAESSWRPGVQGATSVRLLRRADAALGPRESMLKARVLATLALQLAMSGAIDEARSVRPAAESMAKRFGEPAPLKATLYRALVAGGWLPEVLDSLPGMLPELRELHREALHAGDKQAALDLLPSLISTYACLGDIPAAQAQLGGLAALAEEHRQPFYLYYVASARAALALFEGRFAESELLAEQALALGRSLPGLDAPGVYGVQMFGLRREQGRLKELAPVLRHFVDTTPAESTWRPGLALMYAELGMLPEARSAFDSLAAGRFASVARDSTWANCLGMLAEVCCFVGDAASAEVLYGLLSPYAHCNIIAAPLVGCYGVAARHLGMLAATMGNWNDAEGYFEHAIEANSRQGGVPWVAHARYQYAAMLRARGRPADGGRIVALLFDAAATARELGMNALAERIASC